MEFEPGEAAPQIGREAGILRRIRTTRLTLLESLKEALRNPPGGHSREARPSPARRQRGEQGRSRPPHHLPHTPASRASSIPQVHPGPLHMLLFLQGLFRSLFTPFTLTLLATTSSPTNGTHPPVALSSASNSGYFALLWQFILLTPVSALDHKPEKMAL